MGLFKDCGCGCDGKKQEKKLLISVMAALLFFIVASPDAFRVMRRIAGKWVAGPNGCPTSRGLIFHTLVFMLKTWGMMNLKYEGYTEEPIGPSPQEIEEEIEMQVQEETVNTESEDDTEVSMEPMQPPPRMADVQSPLPGMSEEPVGIYDSGAMYGSMDINSEIDSPDPSKFNMGNLSVSCSDGSRPIVY